MTSVSLVATQKFKFGRENEIISLWNITCFLAFKNDTKSSEGVYTINTLTMLRYDNGMSCMQ